ncbi:MAG: GNAT family N-acetyltransferase [Bacillaceae bacterium]
MTYEIFPFTDEKLKDAYNVRRAVFINEQQIAEELEIDELEPEAIHLALYDTNKAVGAGRIRILEGEIGKLERICILKEYRKQGLGKVIMDAFEAYGENQGITTFKLNAQESAVAFYKKLGYVVTSDMFYDAGIPHYEMKKYIETKES